MKRVRMISVFVVIFALLCLLIVNSISKSNGTINNTKEDVYIDKYLSSNTSASSYNKEELYIYNLDEKNLNFKYIFDKNITIGKALKSDNLYIYKSKDKKITFRFRDEYVKVVEYLNNKESFSITLWKE